MIDLPAALLYPTLAFLQDDGERSLRSCALVSKIWVDPSRHHSSCFRTLHITPEQLDRVSILLSPHCTILPHIRCLNLVGKDSKPRVAPVQMNELFTRLDIFPALTSLSCHNTRRYKIAQIHPPPPNLTCLELRLVRFDSFGTLVSSIQAMSQLVDLTLNDINFKGSAWFESDTPLSSMMHLRTLRCVNMDLYSIFSWLLAFDPIPTLNKIHFNLVRVDDAAELGMILQRLGDELKHCLIELIIEAENYNFDEITFAHNTSLESVCVSSDRAGQSLLATVASPSVSTLGIIMAYSDYVDELSYDEVLAMPQFAGVQFVSRIHAAHTPNDIGQVYRSWRKDELLQRLNPPIPADGGYYQILPI